MHLKRANTGVRMRAPAILIVLSAIVLTPTPALALPEGRAYEQVSPVYKAGYGAEEIVAAAPNGESVAFYSFGGFAGLLNGSEFAANTYLARRGASGWSTGSLQPPSGEVVEFSASMEEALASAPLGPNAGVVNFEATEQEFLLHPTAVADTPESWEVDGGIVLKRLDGGNVEIPSLGASGNLCHVVFTSTEGPLLPEAVKAKPQIYDLARGCGGEIPSLRIVALKNNSPATVIEPSCETELGFGNFYGTAGEGSGFNAIADEGNEIFFTTNAEACDGQTVDPQLYVRLGGARTLEVSRPLDLSKPAGGCVGEGGVVGEVPCARAGARATASFVGASEDGSRVFFRTTAPLVSGDQDGGDDLYMATIGCPGGGGSGCQVAEREVTSLVQVSHDPTVGEAAEVQGVTALAPDGSRVYFVARGVLDGEGPSGEGVQARPLKGADNLYVYDSASGRTAFVADLCSGPARSGAVEDRRCPSDLLESLSERSDAPLSSVKGPAQIAGKDGGVLVFSTYAQVIARGPEADTDDAEDVYRYDTETGALSRVSLGEAGYDADGNQNDTSKVLGIHAENADAQIEGSSKTADDHVAGQQELATRAVSDDGARIVFSSAATLSPAAVNGLVNVYEWHEGSVSLISSGSAEQSDQYPVITPAGRDIFFETSQGLVSGDTDGLYDVYDARLGGGFAPSPAPRQPCSGDACQGPLTNPAPLLVPGSVSQAPGGNFAAPAPAVANAKPKAKSKPKRKAKHKQKAKRGQVAAARRFSGRRSGR